MTAVPADSPRPDSARPLAPTATVRDAEISVYDAEPDSGDASDMYVMDVFGVSVLIRLRAIDDGEVQLYVHIDNERRPPTELVVEVCSNGETAYQI